MRKLLRNLLSLLITLAIIVAFGVLVAVMPGSPVPSHWNPTAPLNIAAPLTPVTQIQLERAYREPALCAAALGVELHEDRVEGEHCGIEGRVMVNRVAGLRIGELETACQTALRLAMWAEHGLKPAAREVFGQEITGLRHIGSYNCRRMRTASGASSRWSTHARAASVDIIGASLADGSSLRLLGNWEGVRTEAQFWRAARDASCQWFGLVLGPDYNALHADHFHLQNHGWGWCR